MFEKVDVGVPSPHPADLLEKQKALKVDSAIDQILGKTWKNSGKCCHAEKVNT